MEQAVTARRGGDKKRSADRQVFLGGYVPEDLAKRAKHLAAARGCSMNELIVALLEQAVAQPKKEKNSD